MNADRATSSRFRGNDGVLCHVERPKLRRPGEGGDPAAHPSERRWIPASAGTTEFCVTWGARNFVVPAKAGTRRRIRQVDTQFG